MLEIIKQPWHWSIAGVLIGLTIPILLILGNKPFGISSNLKHICAACLPANIPFFNYNWKKESWNLFFAAGILIGGFVGSYVLGNPDNIIINPNTVNDLKALGVKDFNHIMPLDLFGTDSIFTLKGLLFFVIGGFLVGFGTRYGNGCTSGHAIMGISSLQWPSVVATICFFIGGVIMTHLIYPFIFRLF